MESGKEAFEAAKANLGNTVTGLKNLMWDKLPESARNYLSAHPNLTAFQVISMLVILCPGLVVMPVLGLLGFSSIGPVAGEYHVSDWRP